MAARPNVPAHTPLLRGPARVSSTNSGFVHLGLLRSRLAARWLVASVRYTTSLRAASFLIATPLKEEQGLSRIIPRSIYIELAQHFQCVLSGLQEVPEFEELRRSRRFANRTYLHSSLVLVLAGASCGVLTAPTA